MAVNKGEIGIYGKLVNDTPEGVLAGAEQIFDSKLNKTQEAINNTINSNIGTINTAINELKAAIANITALEAELTELKAKLVIYKEVEE